MLPSLPFVNTFAVPQKAPSISIRPVCNWCLYSVFIVHISTLRAIMPGFQNVQSVPNVIPLWRGSQAHQVLLSVNKEWSLSYLQAIYVYYSFPALLVASICITGTISKRARLKEFLGDGTLLRHRWRTLASFPGQLLGRVAESLHLLSGLFRTRGREKISSQITCIIPITASNLSFFIASVSFSASSSSNLKQILKWSESG